jgi:hypothetical protein
MKIAVLGAGPSGMMAAHAVSQYGHYLDIYDAAPDKARRNSGVYYLHSDCDLLLDSAVIKQGIIGAYGKTNSELAELYGEKVYGEKIRKVSILSAFEKEVVGYNSGQGIDRLWDLYGKQINEFEVSGIDTVHRLLEKYDKVISTIPAYILFPEESCRAVKTWIKVGKAPENEAFVFYNINPYCSWYRCSAMFGIFIQEYGFNFEPEKNAEYSYHQANKVIGEGISSPYQDLFLTGRYGAWDKSCLTDAVYHRTLEWLLAGKNG